MDITKEKIFEAVAEALKVEKEIINEESKYSDFKQWDSLGNLLIVLSLQNNFSIIKSIPDDIIFFSIKEILSFYGVR